MSDSPRSVRGSSLQRFALIQPTPANEHYRPVTAIRASLTLPNPDLFRSARCRNCLRWGSFISIPPPLVSLFDHVVGAGVQGFRHGKAERLRRLEIDHQCELGWHLYRQVSRPLTLEDAIDVASRS